MGGGRGEEGGRAGGAPRGGRSAVALAVLPLPLRPPNALADLGAGGPGPTEDAGGARPEAGCGVGSAGLSGPGRGRPGVPARGLQARTI